MDLRHKVINYLKQRNSQLEVSKIFGLNLSTVSRWWIRFKREGHCNPRKRPGAKARVDKQLLENYINENPHTKLSDIGKIFNISVVSAFHWIKKLGYSYKKKLYIHGSK